MFYESTFFRERHMAVFADGGAVSAVDGPNNGTSTAKLGVFAADGPDFGTSAALCCEIEWRPWEKVAVGKKDGGGGKLGRFLLNLEV